MEGGECEGVVIHERSVHSSQNLGIDSLHYWYGTNLNFNEGSYFFCNLSRVPSCRTMGRLTLV